MITFDSLSMISDGKVIPLSNGQVVLDIEQTPDLPYSQEVWVGLSDAAVAYGVHKTTIVRRAKKGKIKTDKTLSKHTCYKVETFNIMQNITRSGQDALKSMLEMISENSVIPKSYWDNTYLDNKTYKKAYFGRFNLPINNAASVINLTGV